MDKNQLLLIAVGIAVGMYVVPKIREKIGH